LENFATSVRTFKTSSETRVVEKRLGNAQFRVVLLSEPSKRLLSLSGAKTFKTGITACCLKTNVYCLVYSTTWHCIN